MKKLASAIAVAAFGILAACGGNVVVDGSPSGTGGGATQTQTTTTGGGGTGGVTTLPGNGTGGASCENKPASLTQCGVTANGPGCVINYCDGQGDTWTAQCVGSACECLHDGVELCTCALQVPGGDICAGVPDCCYHN